MQETPLPTVAPGVIFKAVPDGAVLFSTADEVYFGLNAVGARMWELLPPVRNTIEEVSQEIARQYPEVDAATIHADLVELLAELTRHGLVRPRNPEQSDAQTPATSDAKARASDAR